MVFVDLEADILKEAKNGDVGKINIILKTAEELDVFKRVLNAQDNRGESALYKSIVAKNEGVAHLLIDQGCDVDTICNEMCGDRLEGDTPLMEASSVGLDEIVRKLVGRGAVINRNRKTKCNAVYLAAQEGHLKTLKFFLEKEPSLANKKSYEGRTILAAAAWTGHLDIVKYIVENYRPNINHQEDNNLTALSQAANFNHPLIVEYLLQQGADESIKGLQNKTALQLSIEMNNDEVTTVLKKHIKKGKKSLFGMF